MHAAWDHDWHAECSSKDTSIAYSDGYGPARVHAVVVDPIAPLVRVHMPASAAPQASLTHKVRIWRAQSSTVQRMLIIRHGGMQGARGALAPGKHDVDAGLIEDGLQCLPHGTRITPRQLENERQQACACAAPCMLLSH
jgi:hypothetical protein